MRRTVIQGCLIGWLVIFGISINLFETVILFLLFGIVPWETAPLSAQFMLTFYTLVAGVVVGISTNRQLLKNYRIRSHLQTTTHQV